MINPKCECGKLKVKMPHDVKKFVSSYLDSYASHVLSEYKKGLKERIEGMKVQYKDIQELYGLEETSNKILSIINDTSND